MTQLLVCFQNLIVCFLAGLVIHSILVYSMHGLLCHMHTFIVAVAIAYTVIFVITDIPWTSLRLS